MKREELLEAQNAYARVEYANEVYSHLIEVSRELTDDPNTDIVGTITQKRELVTRKLSHYTCEIRDEAIRLLRKATMIVISDGLHAAIDYVLEVLKENEILFNNIGVVIREPYWISVEEALPPLIEEFLFSGPILVRYYNSVTGTQHYTTSARIADGTSFRWRVEDEDKNNIVTHWMPIPELIS